MPPAERRRRLRCADGAPAARAPPPPPLQGGVHVVVGTPGRVYDMLRRRALRADNIKVSGWAGLGAPAGLHRGLTLQNPGSRRRRDARPAPAWQASRCRMRGRAWANPPRPKELRALPRTTPCCPSHTNPHHCPPLPCLQMFVLDEADEMLSRGFKDQIYDIFQLLPPKIQVRGVCQCLPSPRPAACRCAFGCTQPY